MNSTSKEFYNESISHMILNCHSTFITPPFWIIEPFFSTLIRISYLVPSSSTFLILLTFILLKRFDSLLSFHVSEPLYFIVSRSLPPMLFHFLTSLLNFLSYFPLAVNLLWIKRMNKNPSQKRLNYIWR